MSQIAIEKFEDRAAMPVEHGRVEGWLRRACADFWLNWLYLHTDYAPWLAKRTKWFYLNGALKHSKLIQRGTTTNARRIFGPDVSAERIEEFARGAVSSFFEFVCDIGRTRSMSREEIRGTVEAIEGHDHYTKAREEKRGAIVVTAHMGSFEAGIAALREYEENIHVVFKRDALGRFEQLRRQTRQKFGVHEAAIDDGWTIWMRLRDALAQNHVVTMQGDRVMPGQKGQRMKFLHGHLYMPTGPVRLAMATGAPLLPVFVTRTPEGKLRVHCEEAIWVDATEAEIDGVHPALLRFAKVLEKYVKAYPEQWLILRPAFCEDAAGVGK